ncbi:ATP-binding protein [Dactylosporangium sp. McL0621]|uniref:ATP-binding protein n=1 Tax=Dactylosporangium sp. McL0621 TaxID=3415678 RepID=UPI003CF45B89
MGPADGGDVTVVARTWAWLRRSLRSLIGQRPRRDLHDDTELLLCELVTNAVLLGSVITVLLRAVDNVLRLTVCDTSPPAPVRVGLDGWDAAAEHGRGVVLIEAVAVRWGVHRPEAAPESACGWSCPPPPPIAAEPA